MNKASGLEFLADRLGFSRERTVAFGDGENDVGALVEWADTASRSRTRTTASSLPPTWCPSDEEEGVAQVLEAYLDSRAHSGRARRSRPVPRRARAQGRGRAFRRPARRRRALARARAAGRRARSRQKLDGEGQADAGAARGAEAREGRAAGEEAELAEAEAERDRLALRVPNVPDDDVPDGSTEDDVREVRRSGEQPALEEVREHPEIGRFDMERPRAYAGAVRLLAGDTARLALALYRFALDRLAEKGFVTALPPVLVRESADRHRRLPVGRGERVRAARRRPLPRGHRRDPARKPPRRGDPRGRRAAPPLRRVLAVLPPRGGRGGAGHPRDVPRAPVQQGRAASVHAPGGLRHRARVPRSRTPKSLVGASGSYRVVVLPAGDILSSASAKTYDVEIRSRTDRYRETASVSTTTDFQARRLGSATAASAASSPCTR